LTRQLAGQEKFIISIYTLPLFLLDEFPQKLQKKMVVPVAKSGGQASVQHMTGGSHADMYFRGRSFFYSTRQLAGRRFLNCFLQRCDSSGVFRNVYFHLVLFRSGGRGISFCH